MCVRAQVVRRRGVTSVAPLVQASLAQYRDRYHDLLNQELALSVRVALRNDLRPLTMTSAAQVESVMTSSGLPQTLAPGAPPPRLPFKAPFSSALPSVRTPLTTRCSMVHARL